MKQVITLIGTNAGNAVYMRPHEADAAVSTGVAAWPDDPKVAHFRKRLGLDKPPADVERRELNIRRVNGGNELVGPWPKHIVLQPRMLASSMVTMHESGTINISIGTRTAYYRAVHDPRDGRILADLVEVVDREPIKAAEAEPKAPAPPRAPAEQGPPAKVSREIPADWRQMHWKHRIQLAGKIAGREVKDVGEANEIIEKANSAVSN